MALCKLFLTLNTFMLTKIDLLMDKMKHLVYNIV